MITKPLTTGDVARYCHVSQFTVSKWIRQGKLSAYVTPGGHYRITLDKFRAFLNRYGMPIDDAFFTNGGTNRKRVLVVDGKVEALQSMIRGSYADSLAIQVASASDEYEAGCQVTSFRPDLIILDFTTPDINGHEVCERIKSDPTSRHIKVLAIVDRAAPDYVRRVRETGADDVALKPIDIQTLLKKTYALLGVSDTTRQ